MSDQVQIRIHGPPSLPTLVFMPGLHGNWTLIGPFRRALAGRVRFVEVTYPDTLSWSLGDFAAGVEDALSAQSIHRAWILAESFSSQVAWPIIARKKFLVEGLILAGGFVRHPMRWGVRVAERVCRDISFSLLTRLLFGYARISRWRFRHSPETIRGIEEFIESLTEQSRQAAKHRLHLVAQSDPCTIAQQTTLPVYALTGLFDPIVPWFWVRPWLKRNCAALRQYKIIYHADHNVLGTGAKAAADQVVKWMTL